MQKHTLANGLRIILIPNQNTKSVTSLVLVGAGSRYESKDINGISHFLEHMFFKGAKKYKNTKEVSSAIDEVGGEFNAFTGKEYAGYYVRIINEHLDTALDVLSDMLIEATFRPEEIDKERGVILEEYNMYQDTPMYQIGWNFENLLYGNQAMGWDQIGSKKLIKSVTQQQFKQYKSKLYTPDNTVICLSGNFDEKSTLKKIKDYFQMGQAQQTLTAKAIQEHDPKKKYKIETKQTEQAHMILGFKSLSLNDPRKYALKVLATALGGNMSSRMFLNVREAQGLCYYIRTESDLYSDCGSFQTRAGVDIKRVPDAIQSIVKEYQTAYQDGFSEEEIHKAKEYLKGKMVLNYEDTESVAHLHARQELILDELKTIDEIIAEFNKVTSQEVNQLAKDLLQLKNLYTYIIGPCEEEQIAPLLKF